MRAALVSVVALGLLAACRSAPKTGPGGAASTLPTAGANEPAVASLPSTSQQAANAAATGAGPATTARLARCGWGPIRAEPGADAPPFAVALVDLEVSAPVRGLHVATMELGSESDVVARMGARTTLRVQEGGASYSFGAADTHDVGTLLPAGTYRLRASAALDRPKKSISSKKPSRCAVVLASDDGAQIVAKGALDPEWENE